VAEWLERRTCNSEAPSLSPALTKGAKKVIFKACHSGKLKLAGTSPNVISTSPKKILVSQFFYNFNSSKKVKNKIHWPDSKIHLPRDIGHYVFCTAALTASWICSR